jgi:anti-sigma B factor antagonist
MPAARYLEAGHHVRSAPGSESLPDISFPVTQRDGIVVVTTPDEIDIGNAWQLREALVSAAAAALPVVVVVDMTGTEYCDSTGLNVLVRAGKRATDDGGELRLVVGGAALQRILAVTGVGSMFRVYDSLDRALKATPEQQTA